MRIDQKIRQIKGFTLIETLLVMVIISVLLYMGINYMQQRMRTERMDRTVMQMQQVLNASLAYYLANGSWPVTEPPPASGWSSTSILQNAGFLSPGVFANPWGPDPDPAAHPSSYVLATDTAKKRLSVMTYIGTGFLAIANARTITGKLPSAQFCSVYDVNSTTACTSCTTDTQNCFLAVSIPVPGQNLNNATGVNYGGVFHSGACVKAPTCPLSTQEPQVIIIPMSVAGMVEAPTGTNCNANNPQNCNVFTTYPLTSFIGYASPLSAVTTANVSPQINLCGTNTPANCVSDTSNTPLSPNAGDRYWRVCIGVDTSHGRVSPGGGSYQQWGQLMGTVAVFTRCAMPNENDKNPSFSVFQQF